MDDMYVIPGRSRCNVEKTTSLHHFRVEVFFLVIKMQLQELNNRFNEASTELLLCVACLNPSNSFYAFDKKKLIRLAKLYPNEFSAVQYSTIQLDNQLETYIADVKSNDHFLELKGLGNLAEKMVETQKDNLYSFVYKLITLALIILVATSTVERVFSAMKIVKIRLRNKMADEWIADSLVTYVEKSIFNSIDNETIMLCFQNMRPCRG